MFFTLFQSIGASAAAPSPSFRPYRPCRGRAHEPSHIPILRPLRAALSGINSISPLRGERFVRNFWKYGAGSKSHAALRLSVVKQLLESILPLVFLSPHRMAELEHRKVQFERGLGVLFRQYVGDKVLNQLTATMQHFFLYNGTLLLLRKF